MEQFRKKPCYTCLFFIFWWLNMYKSSQMYPKSKVNLTGFTLQVSIFFPVAGGPMFFFSDRAGGWRVFPGKAKRWPFWCWEMLGGEQSRRIGLGQGGHVEIFMGDLENPDFAIMTDINVLYFCWMNCIKLLQEKKMDGCWVFLGRPWLA